MESNLNDIPRLDRFWLEFGGSLEKPEFKILAEQGISEDGYLHHVFIPLLGRLFQQDFRNESSKKEAPAFLRAGEAVRVYLEEKTGRSFPGETRNRQAWCRESRVSIPCVPS